MAAKYNDDDFYKNVYYAKVGGITLEEMNMLESHFATYLDYNFFVKPEDFNTYLQKLIAYDVINESWHYCVYLSISQVFTYNLLDLFTFFYKISDKNL